eukprot:4745109-Karenia_brevis.AAC.1
MKPWPPMSSKMAIGKQISLQTLGPRLHSLQRLKLGQYKTRTQAFLAVTKQNGGSGPATA